MSEPVYKVGDPAPPPLPRRSEADVMSRWQGDEPVVSILCPTYQHVGFIEDALRGFLGQDTDFPFEILVRDDASTDGTADIVRDYAARYPNIIRAVLETENRYPEVRPLQVLRPMARGEFIALCEGDDYWFDPRHLQDRVEVLRSDPNANAVVGDTIIVRGGVIVGGEVIRRGGDWNWYLPIRSLVTRAPVTSGDYGWAKDMGLALAIQRQGGLRVLDAAPSAVYRLHPGGIAAGRAFVEGFTGKEGKPELIQRLTGLSLQLAQEGDLVLAKRYRDHALQKLDHLLELQGVPPSGAGRDRTWSRLERLWARLAR